jgi:hypothetical protein
MIHLVGTHLIRRFFILHFFLLVVFTATGQSVLTISGSLVDSENNEPLVFASIGIKNASVSTVSNSQGKFDFHFSSRYKDDILVISMMGYQNTEVPVRNLINKDSILFRLNKATKLLEAVVIQDSLQGEDIARIAVSRIAQNFPVEPFLLDGFYRDLKKLGGTYFSLLEAAVKIYDESYELPNNKERLRERVRLVEVRKSLGYNNKFIRYFDQKNLLEDLLLENDVRYHSFPDLNDISYSQFVRMKVTYFNDHRVYVVERRSDKIFTRMYVDTENYAIIRIEQEQLFDKNIIKKKKRMVSRHVSEKKIVDFKEFRGRMYLNYMTLSSKYEWTNEKNTNKTFETEILQELLINRIHINTDQRIGNTEKMRRYGLQYQDEKYNKEFWQNYNVIKNTPLNDEIVADLEKEGALEFQFEED